MNTKDERAPMLSDAGLRAMCDTGDGTVSFETGKKMCEVRDFYENLITSGELITKEEHDIDIHNAKMDASEETEDRIRNDHSADV